MDLLAWPIFCIWLIGAGIAVAAIAYFWPDFYQECPGCTVFFSMLWGFWPLIALAVLITILLQKYIYTPIHRRGRERAEHRKVERWMKKKL